MVVIFFPQRPLFWVGFRIFRTQTTTVVFWWSMTQWPMTFRVFQLIPETREAKLFFSFFSDPFFICHKIPVGQEKSLLAPQQAGPRLVYHWTPSTNFKSIIDTNLQVPDKKRILNQTDDGYYGAGIYTSPRFHEKFQVYAKRNGGCFLCLGLPGRQCRATVKEDRARPCRPNYETHISPDGQEWVFFSSDQLLPCFLIDPLIQTQPQALQIVQSLDVLIRKELGLPTLTGKAKRLWRRS